MKGFTLVELIVVSAIAAVLAAISMPIYDEFLDRADRTSVIADFADVQFAIDDFESDNFALHDTLAEVGKDGLVDPWGQPYRYLRIDGGDEKAVKKLARQDKNLKPINTDFDLYSVGEDGETKRQLTANESDDDIVRAQNGVYLGYANKY